HSTSRQSDSAAIRPASAARGPVRIIRKTLKWVLISFGLLLVASIVLASVGISTASKTRATRSHRVVRAVVRPRVVVAKIGFSRDDTTPTSSIIDYGLVLANKSSRLDARTLTIVVPTAHVRGRSAAMR